MHKLNETRKGHCYPELVQKENDTIIAEMRGTIWKSNFERISAKFISVVNEPIREGLELLFEVKIVYHPVFGMGLDIVDVDAVFTLGALQRERQETLERLAKEGILNANQRLEFPLLPQRLAIISQANSKGYSDFILLLNGHPKKYKFFTFLFEAVLQGDGAVSSITAQLNRIRRIKEHFDAVLIIRGGGGEVGMHCYNNYELAKAVATFPLPVLTGVGHSTNMTVCEMVAFNNGITPSDLAYWFRNVMEKLDEPLDYFKAYLPQLSIETIEKTRLLLAANANTIRTATTTRMLTEQLRQHKVRSTFERAMLSYSEAAKTALNSVVSELKRISAKSRTDFSHRLTTVVREMNFSFLRLVTQKDNGLINTRSHLQRAATIRLDKNNETIVQIERQIQLLDPENVLKRGYSIVTGKAGIISSKNKPEEGETLTIISEGLKTEATTLISRER